MKKLSIILLTILLFSCENAVQEIETFEIVPEIIIYENVFKISGYSGSETTPLELSEPIINFDGTEYNIETMAPDVNGLPVKTSYTDTERIISIRITIDNFSSFYFVNNNMINIKNIDPQNMCADEFQEMLTFIYPPPEPEIPEYSETKYYLSGYSGTISDYLIVYEDNIMIGGVISFYNEMNIVYMNDIRKIMVDMTIDNKDSFLFINGNMFNFFDIDLQDMSMDEFIITADVLNRYPEETIWGLVEEYNP